MKAIGVFDSGYGGLTVLKELVHTLPEYDFIYVGDNARAPYGSKSFNTIYQYTWQAVQWLLSQQCPLVILACNTASAKALRSIQQINLPALGSDKRVLGVIRPTAEVIGDYTQTGHIGLFATEGTVKSNSYALEIQKCFPEVQLTQEACPMWVPLVESDEYTHPGSSYFIQKHIQHLMDTDPKIDTILLGCTHYPLLQPQIESYLPENVKVVSQGKLVATSLWEYLNRHTWMDQQLSKEGRRKFFTTGDTEDFNTKASKFYGQPVQAEKVQFV
jgi:glutamate racemase